MIPSSLNLPSVSPALRPLMGFCLVGLLTLSLLIAPADAGLIKQSDLTADYTTAADVEKLQIIAANGSREAALKLALVLIEGKLVPADLATAESWLRKALAGQEFRARTPLAKLLLATSNEGQDVDRAAEGLTLLRQAAADNDAEANLTLGFLYAHGRFLAAEFGAAERHFTTAAELKDPAGWFRLGWLHSGEAVFADEAKPDQALGHLETAFQAGESEAGRLLVKMLREGTRVEKDEARAFSIVTAAAERGSAQAQHFLGELYQQGSGTPADPAKALANYRLAAEQGLAQSQNQLGLIYATGNDAVEADAEVAQQWFEKAAEQGFPASAYNMALLMAAAATKADGEEARERAVAYLVSAAQAGFIEAQDRLGSWYRDGIHVTRDVMAASGWFRQAANSGYVQAKINLAQLLQANQNQPEAIQTALGLYSDSAAAGHPVAHFELARMLVSGVLGRIELAAAHAHLSAAATAGYPPAVEALPNLKQQLSEAQLTQSERLLGNLKVVAWSSTPATAPAAEIPGNTPTTPAPQ